MMPMLAQPFGEALVVRIGEASSLMDQPVQAIFQVGSPLTA
jgi:hypothetical protein